MAMLNPSDIEKMGFASVGKNVLISDRASFYGASRISIGDNVRIDDFAVLSAGTGGIFIGSYVHIAIYSSMIGQERISLKDFCGLSARVSVYSSSDDYSGASLTNPMVPEAFTNVSHAPVEIGRHAIIGCGSVVLPGVTLEDGVAIGALSLVNSNCSAFGVYAGTPARFIRDRKRDLLTLEQQMLAEKPL